jgi:hypothetical protein
VTSRVWDTAKHENVAKNFCWEPGDGRKEVATRFEFSDSIFISDDFLVNLVKQKGGRGGNSHKVRRKMGNGL